jgi:hypothetical protein
MSRLAVVACFDMPEIERLIAETIADFREVASLARADFVIDQIIIEITPRPHRAPASLPIGRMAVYAIFLNGQALEVGKVGPKSAARYTSQHYNPGSAQSTLARSVLASPERVGAVGLDSKAAGDWIKNHTDRANLLLPVPLGGPVLSLLEAFLHVRWKPVFEGRSPVD